MKQLLSNFVFFKLFRCTPRHKLRYVGSVNTKGKFFGLENERKNITIINDDICSPFLLLFTLGFHLSYSNVTKSPTTLKLCRSTKIKMMIFKVLTIEKRGGLKVTALDISRFKLFSRCV
jgi:hypothetical protein